MLKKPSLSCLDRF